MKLYSKLRVSDQDDSGERMDWKVKSFEETNHPPIHRLAYGDRFTVKSGSIFKLDTAGIINLDGNSMSYYWFQYPEASAYKDIINFVRYSSNFSANGRLYIEFQDEKNASCVRILFDSTGNSITKSGYRNKGLMKYDAENKYNFIIALNTVTRLYTISINGTKPNNNLVFAPVHKVHHIVFRTGNVKRFPDADTPYRSNIRPANAGEKDKVVEYDTVYFRRRIGL